MTILSRILVFCTLATGYTVQWFIAKCDVMGKQFIRRTLPIARTAAGWCGLTGFFLVFPLSFSSGILLARAVKLWTHKDAGLLSIWCTFIARHESILRNVGARNVLRSDTTALTHSTWSVIRFLARYSIPMLAPYSPVLALRDFYLFPEVEKEQVWVCWNCERENGTHPDGAGRRRLPARFQAMKDSHRALQG